MRCCTVPIMERFSNSSGIATSRGVVQKVAHSNFRVHQQRPQLI